MKSWLFTLQRKKYADDGFRDSGFGRVGHYLSSLIVAAPNYLLWKRTEAELSQKERQQRPLTCPSFHCHASNKWVEQISQNYINSINNEKKYHYLSMSCFSESLNFCLGIQFLKTSPIFMYMSNLQHMNRVFYWSLENSSPTETILYMLTQLLG